MHQGLANTYFALVEATNKQRDYKLCRFISSQEGPMGLGLDAVTLHLELVANLVRLINVASRMLGVISAYIITNIAIITRPQFTSSRNHENNLLYSFLIIFLLVHLLLLLFLLLSLQQLPYGTCTVLLLLLLLLFKRAWK